MTVAQVTRFGDHALGQRPAQASASELRTHIQPLHLADAAFEPVQHNAPYQLSLVLRQQQPSLGRSVAPRQSRELLIEVLKAKTEAERMRVFEKQLPRPLDLLRAFGLRQHQPGECARYPISMPPLTLSTCPVM